MSYDFWSFVTRAPFPAERPVVGFTNKRRLSWFIPPPSPNSGGHINIFRFLFGLENEGYSSSVVIVHDASIEDQGISADRHKENINKWYGPFDGSVQKLSDGISPTDVAIATGWQTAYAVSQFIDASEKFYFVQDFEPYFNPVSSASIFAENTYRLPLKAITAGSWLSRQLREKYGMKAYPISFSFDKSLYQRTVTRDPDIKRLFVYARQETPRRGWELAMLALGEFHKLNKNVEFVLAGGRIDTDTIPFPAFAPGVLRQQELADLYTQCQCSLVISLTNLSLLPLELMACGVPVVINRGENNEWLVPNGILVLAECDPLDIAKKLDLVFTMAAPDYDRLVTRGLDFAASTSWQAEIKKMGNIIRDYSTVSDEAELKPIEIDLPHHTDVAYDSGRLLA